MPFAGVSLFALHVGQHMRHADIREDRIVPAGGTRTVYIETTQIGVEPVGAARTRDHAQVRRRHPVSQLGRVRVHRRLHRGTQFDVFGQLQVLLDLLFRHADVLQAVIAHVGGAVAGQAPRSEELGAALQGDLVLQIHRGLVQVNFRTAGDRQHRHRHQQRQHP